MDDNRFSSGGEGESGFFEKRQIIRSLSAFENFPVLSGRAARIIAMLREKPVNLSKLALIMERSKTFRDHFVRLSGVPEIGEETVKEAMRALGWVNTCHLISSFLVMPLYTYNDREEWEHVYSTSILLCNLQKHYRLPDFGLSLPAVLLHDIGVSLLRRFTPHRYDQIKRLARESRQYLEEAEESSLKVSHEIGRAHV